ncbi:MAG: PQQ-binding-like beta-propeller repeat protein [Aureliella sp.]
MTQTFRVAAMLAITALLSPGASAEDWSRFRGPLGNAVSSSDKVPTTWSPSANLSWKTELPGPGASSPIVVGGKAFVTCYSGYGLEKENPGEIENLVRHLVCVDLATGNKDWQKDVPVSLPEDPYTGIGVTAHGYASHTPVSDGKNVYAFFGKGGVHAFDMDGNALWNAQVGKESDPAKWGSSSSPVVFENIVIVTASAESQAIVGLDRETGNEVWRQEAKGLDNMWGTPSLVKVADDRTELVMCVAKELWGLDPRTGELLWYADATGAQQAYASIVQSGKKVFAFTGRGGGSIALEVGGKGNISDSNTVWTGRDSASFASPVGHDGKLYLVTRGVLTVVDAESGKRLEQLRLKGVQQTGGRFGSLDYPSPIVVGDRLYYLNGSGQMFVFSLGDKTQQIALNRFTTAKETFWGTPAVSDDRLVVRSEKHLYCIVDKNETVTQDAEMLAQADQPAETDSQNSRGSSGSSGGRSRQFDPMSMFNDMDKDKDGKVSMQELEGNRMAEQLKRFDKDGDKAISKEEFTAGLATMSQNRGGSGRSGSGRGGYGGRGEDKRPERPQRPKMAK